MTRWIVIGLLAAAGIGVWIYSVSPRGIPVMAAPAERQTIRAYIEERAKTRLPEIHRITMPLQGTFCPLSFRKAKR